MTAKSRHLCNIPFLMESKIIFSSHTLIFSVSKDSVFDNHSLNDATYFVGKCDMVNFLTCTFAVKKLYK